MDEELLDTSYAIYAQKESHSTCAHEEIVRWGPKHTKSFVQPYAATMDQLRISIQ
jgi:hypothetical protein